MRVPETSTTTTGVPLLSPLAWLLAYRYPVHEIRPDFRPEAPPASPTHLVVYRNREDRVKFMKLNGVSARVVELLKENRGRSGLDVLNAVIAELDHPRPDTVRKAGADLLRDLAARDVILGTKR